MHYTTTIIHNKIEVSVDKCNLQPGGCVCDVKI